MSDQEKSPGAVAQPIMGLERQILLWALAVAVMLTLLYSVSSILTPFVAGTVLGYLLNPVADRLKDAGLSRSGAAFLLLGVFILVVGLAGLLLVPVLARQLEGFVTSLPGYLATLQGLFSEWSDKLTADYKALLREHGLEASMPSLDLQKYVNGLISDNAANIGEFTRSLLSRGIALINIVSVLVVTPVVAFYMLLDWEAMVAILDGLSPPRYREEVPPIGARDRPGDGGISPRAIGGLSVSRILVCFRSFVNWLEFRFFNRCDRWMP